MFSFFKNILNKTRSVLGNKLRALFSKPLDEATFDHLEQILYEADLGVACAADFTEHVKTFLKKNPKTDSEGILQAIRTRASEILNTTSKENGKEPNEGEPLVILIVGVNGSGKTTTIAKMANHYKNEGKNVLLAAGDTFRAAAIEQLDTWAKRLGVDIVKAQPQSDPSSVAFDALTAAKARKADVVLIDTAGRLQTKTDLMKELEKIGRVCTKVIPSAPHQVLLILDATVGQNAIDQAKTFHQFTPISGIILTKLDGSAKGGIALSIYEQLGIPIRWIGTGETPADFQPFDPTSYISSLF